MKPLIFRKKNKKGAIGIILFFVILFLVLVIGFIGSIAIGIFNFAGDEITPIFLDLGIVGDTNLSEAAESTFVPVNRFNQALPWLMGFVYVAALMFSIIFAISMNANPHPSFIGLYLVLIILLIFGSIVMSNMYENIFEGDDKIGEKLREQKLLSYMILYSPFILALIALLTGIYLFAKPPESGGFGI